MKRNKMTEIMIRAAISKIIRDMKEDPERGIKNLIELADKNASGRARDILEYVKKELNDKNSAYRKLLIGIFSETDEKILTEFGFNLGYSAFSVGADTIRQIGQREGHKIPWSVFFDMSWGSYPAPDTVDSLVKQGLDMGIYCYMFHIDRKYSGYAALLDIISKNPDCVFFLFLYTPAINDALISRIRALKNVMVLLKLEAETFKEDQAAARLIVQSGCLCGCFVRYSSRGGILWDEGVLSGAESLGFPFLVMLCNERLARDGENSMKRYVGSYRMKLKRPVLPVDLWSDMIFAGTAAGTGACLMTVSGGDQIIITDYERRRNIGGIDIKKPLSAVFKENLRE